MRFSILNVAGYSAFSMLKVYEARFCVRNLGIDQALKTMRESLASCLSRYFLEPDQGEELGIATCFLPARDCLKSATDTASENLATFVKVGSELFHKICGCIHVDSLAWGNPRRYGR